MTVAKVRVSGGTSSRRICLKSLSARRHRPPPGSSVTRPQRLRVHTNLSSSNGNTLALQNRQLSIRPNTTSRTSPLCPRHKTNSRMSGIFALSSDLGRTARGRAPAETLPAQANLLTRIKTASAGTAGPTQQIKPPRGPKPKKKWLCARPTATRSTAC